MQQHVQRTDKRTLGLKRPLDNIVKARRIKITEGGGSEQILLQFGFKLFSGSHDALIHRVAHDSAVQDHADVLVSTLTLLVVLLMIDEKGSEIRTDVISSRTGQPM